MTPSDDFTEDEYHKVALQIVVGRRPPEPRKSWSGGTAERCEAALDQLKIIRQEFQNHEPPKLRRHIMKWMDYYEREAQEALEDCRTGKSRRELDEYRERMSREDRRAAELRKHLAETNQ